MAKNDFQCGGWNYYTLQCGMIMTLVSPGDCTLQRGCWIITVNSPSGSSLQCDKWLWDDMPLNSPGGSTLQCDTYLWDHDNVTGGSGMTCHGIRPNVRHIGIIHLVSILTITAVDMSLCTSLRNFIKIGPPSAEKNDVMSSFKMADLSYLGF